jgi:putative ABC transport system permease protein
LKSYSDIPPKSAQRFLNWFLRGDLAEEVQGDLDEQFYSKAEITSLFKAKLNYWFQVINYLRPFAISKSYSHSNHFAMYRNYFKIGWRNLTINKGYSFINISGLATGMAVAILIGLWVWDELSFNKNHENYDRIGQVMRTGSLNDNSFTYPYLPYALGEELQNVYGGSFKHVVVTSLPGSHILSHEGKKLFQKGSFINKGAPEMFTFNMLKGTWNGLDDMHSVLLSTSAAFQLFGDEDPLEKTLTINNGMEVQVTGVYEDFPHNSHFHEMDFFAPFDLYVSENPWMRDQGFGNNFLNIYVELQPTTDYEKASFHIKDAILSNVKDRPDYVKINPQVHLHPMSRWHLYSEWEDGISTGGLIKFVWLFGIVGLFVLLLACINFMNLSTARSEKRAKEVGIRKAIGSIRRQLVGQFFTESFLMVMLAFALAIILGIISLGWFNALSGKQLTMPWQNIYFWLISVLFILVTGFVSGSYPALYLSSFSPLKVLKGTFSMGRKAAIPRRVLVVIQFTVSVTLIIGTIIVFKQVEFVKDRPTGYTRDNLVMIQMTTHDFHDKYEALEAELRNSGVVEEMARSLSPVTSVWSSNSGFEWRGIDPGWQQEDFATLSVTPNYGKTVGWQFTKGRDFNIELASDSTGFVINESAARLMGFENPVGEIIGWNYTNKKYTIIGVIKDMVMDSPFSTPRPAVFYLGGGMNWINIKINAQMTTRLALTEIEAVFNNVIPAVPFSYKFADQEYALKFIAEERIGKLSGVFTLLAIFISCLGLFGLASFIVEQRSKEIGIRKVLGASTLRLWKILSKEFVILVLISSLIAIPIAYHFMDNWLQDYNYQVNISWSLYVIAGLSVMLLTLIIVSFQAIRVALMNPVNSLRSE